MKVMTNVQCASLEELMRHTFVISLTEFFQKREPEIQLVAVDVFKTDNPEQACKKNILLDRKNLKLVKYGAIYDNLRNVFLNSRNLNDFETTLSPVIEKFRAAIKQEKPDIVLVNCTYYLPWCLYVAAKKESVGKVIVYYHGILKKEAEDYEPKTKDILLQMEKSFHIGNDLIVLPSIFAKKTLEKEVVGRELKNWTIVPNPIPDYFFKTRQKEAGAGKNIGAVIRWCDIKNPKFLNEFARYGVENKKRYKVSVVSKPLHNDDILYRKMKKSVNFIDPLSNSNLPLFYSEMDAVVCPSHFETYGNVAQEALASGTPALVSLNMGIADLYREIGIGDWVLDFDDFKTTAGKIEEASFETVSPSIREELRKRLNIDVVYGRFLKDILLPRL
jgi:glycosyltransferase involved in cell wall biosynthesis